MSCKISYWTEKGQVFGLDMTVEVYCYTTLSSVRRRGARTPIGARKKGLFLNQIIIKNSENGVFDPQTVTGHFVIFCRCL